MYSQLLFELHSTAFPGILSLTYIKKSRLPAPILLVSLLWTYIACCIPLHSQYFVFPSLKPVPADVTPTIYLLMIPCRPGDTHSEFESLMETADWNSKTFLISNPASQSNPNTVAQLCLWGTLAFLKVCLLGLRYMTYLSYIVGLPLTKHRWDDKTSSNQLHVHCFI